MKKHKRAARPSGSDHVQKIIGTPELEDGGKKVPAHFPGESGVLDEDEKGPAMFQSQGKEDIPSDGLVFSPAWLAESVVTEKKTFVVKTKPFDIEGKTLLVLAGGEAFGTVKLGKMEKMDEQRFRDTEMEHLISPKQRDQWCEIMDGWCAAPYYGWPVKEAVKFSEPRPVDSYGHQTLIRGVVLKSIRVGDNQIFMCARLPEEMRKKFSELSSAIAKVAECDAEDVDHITLLWVPTTFDISKETAEEARKIAEDVIVGTGSIDVKIQGWAYFDGAEQDCEKRTALVALVDAPGLADIHVALKTALTATGLASDQQTHGFTPHFTLAYLPHGSRIERLPVIEESFTIEGIEFVHSDIHHLTLKSESIEKVEKKFELDSDADPEHATSKELLEAHDELHFKFRLEAHGKGDPKFSIEDLVNLHALIVDEMRNRRIKHPAPPDDGLDKTSERFESTEDGVKKEYARVSHSGNEVGDSIHISEVLDHFKTFKLRKPYIYLVGGLANHGRTEGDIDILVKDSPDLPEDFKHALHFRLGRALPGELAERLQIHYDEFHGPFTNFVELYDLTFERVNPHNEVKQMSLDGLQPKTAGEVEMDLSEEREKVYAELAADLWEEDDVPTD